MKSSNGFLIQSFLILILGATFAATLFFAFYVNNRNNTERSLLQTARNYSKTFNGVRDFYLHEVVDRIDGSNVTASHDYRNIENTIPIPATFMIELSNFLNRKSDNITFALVSDYPFNWRKGRLLTDFDQRALSKIRESGGSEFFELFEENNTTFLHYANPVIMQPGCVSCHNTHPESPKKDWKVGDIRAVQIFEIPADGEISNLDFQTSVIAAMILFTGTSAVFSLLLLNRRAARSESMLKTEAYIDTLTGTMRRNRFQQIYDNQERKTDFYIFLIDIDDFKSFNTNYGHSTGDVVLREVAKSIERAIPDAEVVCRFGGEEFLVLIPVVKVDDEASYFDAIIADVSNNKISIDNQITNCTISAGYVVLKKDDDFIVSAEKADAALRYAKRNGKNQAVAANHQLLEKLGYSNKNYKRADITSAIKKQELMLFFQPIVQISSRKPVAYEALVRWCPQNEFPIPPTGYLSQYMSALRDPAMVEPMRKMVRRSLPPKDLTDSSTMSLTFNFDPQDLIYGFEENALTPVLLELLSEGYNIGIEIIETPYLYESAQDEIRGHLERIASYGFTIHLDDFGKEGSSIERLASYSFSVIKADRSLISGLVTSERKQQVLALLLDMTSSIGAKLVVEGVEDDEQCEVLAKLGIKYAQGFLFGRPQFLGDKETSPPC